MSNKVGSVYQAQYIEECPSCGCTKLLYLGETEYSSRYMTMPKFSAKLRAGIYKWRPGNKAFYQVNLQCSNCRTSLVDSPSGE